MPRRFQVTRKKGVAWTSRRATMRTIRSRRVPSSEKGADYLEDYQMTRRATSDQEGPNNQKCTELPGRKVA